MKLSGREATSYLAKPNAGAAGALLYGADAMRVALKREALILAMIGPDGVQDMRLTRMTGGDLRGDPAALGDALKVVGFFPGPRAVLLEQATDANAGAIENALQDWTREDAFLVVTAGTLNPRNKLRKAFEAAPNAFAIGVYTDPPRADEVEAMVRKAGMTSVSRDAMRDLIALAAALDPGDFAQFLEKLSLYCHGQRAEVTPQDVEQCAPVLQGGEHDGLIGLAADGRGGDLVREFARLGAQSSNPTALTIAAARHFRTLYAASVSLDGPDAALARARPPVFGPRRTRMAAQCRAYGRDNLENALMQITATELDLRSGRPIPGLAMVERLFIRLSRLRRNS